MFFYIVGQVITIILFVTDILIEKLAFFSQQDKVFDRLTKKSKENGTKIFQQLNASWFDSSAFMFFAGKKEERVFQARVFARALFASDWMPTNINEKRYSATEL